MLTLKILKFDIENSLHTQNPDLTLVGCDEVGRGCIAGPIVGGAVYWDKNFIANALEKLVQILTEENFSIHINAAQENEARVGDLRKIVIKYLTKLIKLDIKNGLAEDQSPYFDLIMLLQIDDSKKLSHKKRELLTKYIKEKARAHSIFEISAQEIDNHGVGEANKKVLENSTLNIINSHPNPKIGVLVDHFDIFKEPSLKDIIKIPITKGDQKSLSIAAASIIAKVHRDNLMQKFHLDYPAYQFDSNVGYGTVSNISALRQHGLSPIHRKSFCQNFF